MLKVELTEEQAKNLIVFLTRVDLTGSEVPSYTGVVNAIQKARLESTPEEVAKGKKGKKGGN